jgi:hypothetical protein
MDVDERIALAALHQHLFEERLRQALPRLAGPTAVNRRRQRRALLVYRGQAPASDLAASTEAKTRPVGPPPAMSTGVSSVGVTVEPPVLAQFGSSTVNRNVSNVNITLDVRHISA